MNWSELIAEIPSIDSAGDSAAPIASIEYDSRRVHPGSVFVAMKGASTDGNRFVEKALAAGAVGIVTDSPPTFDRLLVY
ncbi:MAG: Mur ligase domain-containing protein, partial [Pirellulales bacterium]